MARRTVTAFYNEIDPRAAEWLRELIKAGQIAPGIVCEDSIEDLHPTDLRGFTQCHFFGGVGVWSHALRQAGWPDDQPIWTGSCPCQPFSAAGKSAGFADERHLWPAFFHLIQNGKPRAVPVIGEQVASKDGLAWLDLVHADLEGAGYTVGAVDTCAAGFGAPHQRQRLYWVGYPIGARLALGQWDTGVPGRTRISDARKTPNGASLHADALANSNQGERGRFSTGEGRESDRSTTRWVQSDGEPESGGSIIQLADTKSSKHERQWSITSREQTRPTDRGSTDQLADTLQPGWSTRRAEPGNGPAARSGGVDTRPGPVNGFWADADWILCTDGKWRAIEPGLKPLAHGVDGRVGLLRGYGNAICAPQATGFIEAVMEDLSRLR